MFGMPVFELIELAVAVIAAGIVTGLLAGLFGIGGGAVIVPVLYEAFRLAGVPEEVRMQLCIGTSLVTAILTLYRKPIHSAVATASGIGVPITIAGTLGYALAGLPHQSELPPLSIGFVSVIGLVMIAPISSYVAPLGARLAHAASKRTLEIGFGVFLVLAAARFLWSLIAQQ